MYKDINSLFSHIFNSLDMANKDMKYMAKLINKTNNKVHVTQLALGVLGVYAWCIKKRVDDLESRSTM